MSIHAVIFDYGNVLCPMPTPEDFERLARLSGIDGGSFLQHFWRHRLEYDRGSLDGHAYWHAVGRDAATALADGQVEKLIATDIALWERIDPALLAWVKRLRAAGLKTAILSNMPIDVSRHLRQTVSWLNQFDNTTFSAELGLVKPEPEIYHACLAALNVGPAETLFIDDIAANVEAARVLGMQGLRFENLQAFAKDVAAFRFSAL